MKRLRYRAAKKAYRVIKTGKVSVGTAQYGARYVHANVKKNYSNPVVRKK